MICSTYKVALKLKTPSEAGRNIDFRDEKESILCGVNEFNNKFRLWNKRIIVNKIEKNHMSLILVIEKEKEKVTAREIRSFTAYLYHEKQWMKYSRETSKLFEGFIFSKIGPNEAKGEIKFAKDNNLYDRQQEDCDYVTNYIDDYKIKEVISKDTLELPDDLTDEQAINILKYLLSTKSIGANQSKKKDDIFRIKNILLEWI